ncbi:hydantoinase/oxoprolinase family protein [Paenibacillus sp. 1P07SE]|uniref:hydantoinase/oxoprolinase family protein n=1 Tax=Paenibacillus sp. 1P07SE TaxID=3132209 RepID=UPI0039A50526
MTKYTLGIDVGGTFTDLVAFNTVTGEQMIDKASSTPADPSIGVLNGLESIAAKLSLTRSELLEQTKLIVHGTTVTTNAVLTGRGAKTALLTTEGFRDILQMRRGVRSKEHLFNNKYVAPAPLVERDLRIGLKERTDAAGELLQPVLEQEIAEAARLFKEEGVDAVAICFMHACANPTNEIQAAELMRKLMPEAFVTYSSEVSPMVRLYNRVSTTVMNAYVGPVLKSYIDRLLGALREQGFRQGELLIMQSNGGITSPQNVAEIPATTVLSGPAGGPVAGSAFARAYGREQAIVIDMGGTSFEASIIRGGEVTIRKEGEINRNHISLPMADIHSIGSGGGSIAWIDDGGILRVGPQSAGATPGPACYGRGGELPTCSDADLVLGYLNGDYFLGGEMKLDVALAERAIREHIAEPLGLSVEEAAYGIYTISNLNMVNGIKEITVQNGYDPREFPLVVAGGAAPVHAAMMARELDMSEMIIPKYSSVLCAVGMLASDLRHDYVKSFQHGWSDIELPLIEAMLRKSRQEGWHALGLEGVTVAKREVVVGIDMRYSGQHYEVTIEFDESLLLAGDKAPIEELFHNEHERLYGFDLRHHELEVVNLRLSCRGKQAVFELPSSEQAAPGEQVAPRGSRRMYDPALREPAEAPIYDGESMKAGTHVQGPCIVELITTTIIVPTGFELEYGTYGSFIMKDVARGERS